MGVSERIELTLRCDKGCAPGAARLLDKASGHRVESCWCLRGGEPEYSCSLESGTGSFESVPQVIASCNTCGSSATVS